MLGLLTFGQGLGFFSVLRSFSVRVYLRVSYSFVGLRFFKFRVVSRPGFARFAYGFVGLMVFQFRGFFRLGYILGLVTVL